MASSGNETYVLAIDLGSGGPKASLVSDRGELFARTSRNTSTVLTPDGGGEQDPDGWWQAITECVHELIAGVSLSVDRIVAVSIATQWSVTVPVDRQGRHLMNAIHWTDSRGAPYTKAITGGWPQVAGYGLLPMYHWVRLTGGIPTHSGADALAHILFLRHERSDIYNRAYKLLEPMDYLNFRLTGRAVATPATVYPYLLTDNRDHACINYDAGLLARCGLDRDKLPDIVPVGTVLGTILPEAAREWGLSPQTQVVAGTPDSQAGAVGSGAVADYDAHVCLGTTAWLSCHVPFKKTNLLDYLATMPSGLRDRNMVVAEQGAAGKCLSLFLENWLFPADELQSSSPPDDLYPRLERLVEGVAPGADGLIFLPWLNGAGPPSGESTVRGGFLNQSLYTGRAQAVRAILEGVAFNLRWLQGSVERFAGRRFESLRFIGGGARMDAWCQILADVLQRPIHRVKNPNMAISRGAAMVALLALGRIDPKSLASLAPIEQTFRPLSEHRQVYEQLFAEFLNSYKANRRMFRRLQARRPQRPS